MTNWTVIAAQVAEGRKIWRLLVSVLVGHVQDACFMTPHVPAKANIKQWNENWQPRRSHQSHVTTWSRSLSSCIPPPSNFFPCNESKTAPKQCCSLRPTAALCLVLIQLIVWYEAETPLCLSSYSYHGVTGWYTDSVEILLGAEHWKWILALHSDCIPGGLPSCWILRVVLYQQLLL